MGRTRRYTMQNQLCLELQLPEPLLDKYRYALLDDHWWHATVDGFFDYHAKGFNINGLLVDPWVAEFRRPGQAVARREYQVDFELSRQGEYAYFPCSVCDITQYITTRGLADQFPTLLKYHEYGKGNDLEFITRHAQGSCSFYIEYEPHNLGWYWNDMDESTTELMDQWLIEEADALNEIIYSEVEDLFAELKADLQADYDWQASDEYLVDFFKNNWTLDETVAYLLRHGWPVVWQSPAC